MEISENITFEDGLPLSKQSEEFKSWYNNNIHPKITDQTIPDSLDEYNRPVSFTLQYETFTVKVYWLYILQDASSWACSDFNLEIN